MSKIEFIGHRGLSSEYVENSLEAILVCNLLKDIDGAEIDIRMTKDGVLVNMHNGSLSGITKDLKGKIIDTPFEDLKKCQFYTPTIDKVIQYIRTLPYNLEDRSYFNAYRNTQGQNAPIITFEDILNSFSRDKKLVVEAKVNKGEYTTKQQQYYEDALIDMFKNFHYQSRNIVLKGYNLEAMLRIKEKLPELQVGGLFSKKHKEILKQALNHGFDFVSCEYGLVDLYLIDALLEREMALYSWDDKEPLNHYKLIRKVLIDYYKIIGDDNLNLGIITDFPVRAKEYILQNHQTNRR